MDAFTTPRLMAERLDESHLADLVALHLDPEVSRYLGGVRSAETTRTYLATNLAHWDEQGFGLWVVRTPEGAFVGRVGLRHVPVDGVPEVEIAYTLARPFWGQGFASEIAGALTRIAFQSLGLPSLVGVVMLGNGASRRVLEKVGFAFEKAAPFHGEPCVVYRLGRHGGGEAGELER